MKILLVVTAVIVITILTFGILFVQWANRPENVEALQKKRQADAAQKIEDEQKQAQLNKEIEAKKADLKLVIDENFADKRFSFLDYKDNQISCLSFKENQLDCSATITKGQNPFNYFIFSKEDFGDFVAEMDLGIWGTDASTGIFWDAQPNGERNPAHYQAAYSSPNNLSVKTETVTDFGLGGIIESENNQLLRVERFGSHLKVSVNGRVLFDKNTENAGQGKVGIYLGDRGGIRENLQSISIGIKSFKVWK